MLLRELKKFYKARGRHDLPWRDTRDPYKILVSEVMLQQTQVERVVPFYKKFIKRFPSARALARAPLREVLKEWQGLGYNRRAKYLHEAARLLSGANIPGGGSRTPVRFSRSREMFAELPGVGPYTAAAVACFAFNKPEVFIETNIRTVFIHANILQNVSMSKISDAQLLPLVEEALKKSNMPPREFYWALMDYGAYLKKSGVRLNHRSKHYVKQSKFKGSARQLRGALLRELLKKPATKAELIKKFSPAWSGGEIERELIRLVREGLVKAQSRRFAVV